MSNIAARLDRVLRAAGLAIAGVSIGDESNRATWKVSPVTFQAAAQSHIDAFNPNDPALEEAERDMQAREAVNRADRLIAAAVWVIIEAYSPPVTIAKYENARRRLVDTYRARPWLP